MEITKLKRQCTIQLDEETKYSEIKQSKIIDLNALDKITLDFSNIQRVNSHVLNIIAFLRKNFDNTIAIININENAKDKLNTFGLIRYFTFE